MALICEDPKPGDLIEISNTFSQHWFLYEGDGHVVHLAPSSDSSWSSIFSLGRSRKVMKRELLKDLAGSCRYRVNNHLDGQCPPLPLDRILRQVKEKIGACMGRNVKGKDLATYLRYGVDCSGKIHVDPKPGDLIEIFRKDKDAPHWAICVGEGRVLHVVPPGDSSWSSTEVVKREHLKDVAGGHHYRVNNHLDSRCPPLPPDRILCCGKRKIGAAVEYRGGGWNFVTHMRYGVAFSEQFPKEPNPGDLIEIFSAGGEKHWALCVDEGYIVHLAVHNESRGCRSSTVASIPSITWEVKRELLKDVVGVSPYQVDNQLDKDRDPVPVEEILRRAGKMVGEKITCNPEDWNCEHFVTHLRYDKAYNLQFPLEPNPGDLIEIFSSGDEKRWALYVGEGNVMHLAVHNEYRGCRSSRVASIPSITWEVKQALLKDVAGVSHYRVNNKLDEDRDPVPVEEILRRAGKMVGEKITCNPEDWNCEHFVTHLRYDKAYNLQFPEEPNPGDLIEIFGAGDWKRWALYVGCDYIVHLAVHNEYRRCRSSRVASIPSLTWEVKQALLKDVAGVSHYRVNNQLDEDSDPVPVEEILRRARKMVGEKITCNPEDWNCEHFVTHLRYDKAYNLQFPEEPNPGDLIEIFGAGDQKRWALCVGSGYLMHLAVHNEYRRCRSSRVASIPSLTWEVKQALLKDVVGVSHYRVNNQLDEDRDPVPVEEILRRARKMVGENITCNPEDWNCELFVTHLRYDKAYNLQFTKEPNPGDLIEIFGAGDEKRWALSVGEGYVVHLAAHNEYRRCRSSRVASIPSLTWEVKQALLKNVVGVSHYRVNNNLDKDSDPVPVEEILRRARKMVGEKITCNPEDWNCKHFVTHLRYDKAYNLQFPEEPNPGDLIEIFGAGEEKLWALCVNKGYVVHLAAHYESSWCSSSTAASIPSITWEVKKALLKNAVGVSHYRVNNKPGKDLDPVPVKEILRRAQKMIGEKITCNTKYWNCEHFVTHLRYDKAYNLQFPKRTKPGDLIEIFGAGDEKRWVLYVGGGYVVHLVAHNESRGCGSSTAASIPSITWEVKQELLKDVVGISHYRVNNELDKVYSPLPVDETVWRAKKMIGEKITCNPEDWNCKHFVMYLRYDKARNPQFHKEPKPGDLIEIFRSSVYKHWALYVGEGYVVHLAAHNKFPGYSSSRVASMVSNTGEVKQELLNDVLRGNNYQVNNELDTKYEPLPVEEILRRAREMIGKKISYDIGTQNCEHFVTHLRYGNAHSLQVEEVVAPSLLVTLKTVLSP